MNVVKRFGGVTAVLVATGRKGMTLVLSFVIFPKAFSWLYLAGATMVLGGLLVSSLIKIRKNSESNDKRLSDRLPLVKKDSNIGTSDSASKSPKS